ncbi:type II toxin-antitoxin system prevent-host-death family antitoxin [Pseudogemmobacter sonorensis]|uniref:type II toxin-antitoxin system prevent-host-death family antitoxin n=1 Tax=Pseudogemmobacter sonorensis TaxID=2989681 RepID=UPI0036AA6BC6
MPNLPEFKAADLTRNTPGLFEAAIRSPVAITKHRKPKFVLMSIGRYEQITGQSSQQAHTLDDMPADLKAMMIAALKEDLAGEEDE